MSSSQKVESNIYRKGEQSNVPAAGNKNTQVVVGGSTAFIHHKRLLYYTCTRTRRSGKVRKRQNNFGESILREKTASVFLFRLGGGSG